MARDKDRDARRIDSVIPEHFPDTTPPSYVGSDYSFTLQTVLDLKGSVGRLSQAVETLIDTSKDQGRKIDRISHIIYAAGAVVTLLGIVAGFLLNKLADVLIVFVSHLPPK